VINFTKTTAILKKKQKHYDSRFNAVQ